MNELQHHGVLGMKWGVRRYQNKDGSLTSSGRKRYGYDDLKRSLKKSSQKTKNATTKAATKTKNVIKDNKKKISPKHKKALIVAGSVFVAGCAAKKAAPFIAAEAMSGGNASKAMVDVFLKRGF